MQRTLKKTVCLALAILTVILTSSVGELVRAAAPAVSLTGARTVRLEYQGKTSEFEIAPPTWLEVTDERWDALPVFNPNASSWAKGRVLRGVNACECAVFGALDPDSVVVKLENGELLTRGSDYEFDNSSGALGRLSEGKIGENIAVLASYRCVESRIDSIFLSADGKIALVQGESRVLSPEPPVLETGCKRLVNVYTTGRDEALTDSSLFPVDDVFSDELDSLDAPTFVANVAKFNAENGLAKTPECSDVGAVKKFLPKTWAKLVNGEEVRILAWGDSVTACGFLPDDQRWQVKFGARLQEMFPDAKIVVLTEAWGGRSSDSYRNEPAGSPKNYQEKVLGLKPDLIISEFVNDAYMDEATAAKRYGEMLADFKGIGAEWIILGPHYVRPDWMGLTTERDVDDDPRPLIKGLRKFCEENGVPFADTPTLYGKLWRSGVPYLTLMTNNINHPNNFGMELFSAALVRLFEE